LGRATWEACSGNLEEKWEPSQHLRLGPRKTKKTNSTNISPIMIINRIYENQNLLSL